jgi:hypothetical protein
MKKFVFVYYGKGVNPETVSPEDMKKTMDSWMTWFGSFKENMVDGGNPFAMDGKSVSSQGVETIAADKWPATGYTIINANDMDEAVTIAKGCPAITEGGSVRVYEAMPM